MNEDGAERTDGQVVSSTHDSGEKETCSPDASLGGQNFLDPNAIAFMRENTREE